MKPHVNVALVSSWFHAGLLGNYNKLMAKSAKVIQAEHKILLFGNSVGPYITWWDKQEVNVRNQQRPSQMQNESTGIIVSVRSRSFLLGGGVFVVHNLS